MQWLVWAGRLNQLSLLPFLAFLYTLHRIPGAPRRAVWGWTLYLLFVAVAIPAGIYCKTQLGTSMANVDTIHGACEALLSLANLCIVLGLRDAVRQAAGSSSSTQASGEAGNTSRSTQGAPAGRQAAPPINHGGPPGMTRSLAAGVRVGGGISSCGAAHGHTHAAHACRGTAAITRPRGPLLLLLHVQSRSWALGASCRLTARRAAPGTSKVLAA